MPENGLRIAFLVDTFPLVSETFVLDQITALLDLGHKIDVYARWRPDPEMPVHPAFFAYELEARTTYVDERLPPEAGYWEIPAQPADGDTWVPGRAEAIPNRRRLALAQRVVKRWKRGCPSATAAVLDPEEFGYQAESLSALYRLDVLASLHRSYDVLHAQFGPAANTFRFARDLWGAPLVVSFHGYDLGAYPRSQGQAVYTALFRSLDAATVNSDYARRRLVALGCPPNRVTVLPVGVDVELPAPARTGPRDASTPLRLIVVARLVAIKGVKYAIEAVSMMAARQPVVLDIVGDGPLRRELEALAESLGVARFVTFAGAEISTRVRARLEAADILLLPSVNLDGDEESQGLVLQEAQAAGIPVVATSTGGIPEGMVDGVTGILVPPADAEALERAVLRLAADPDARRRMGNAGQAFVRDAFDRRRLVEDLVRVYREVLPRSGTRDATA